MRRLLGLGDNTVDLYVDHNLMYPGGNAVNVAVLTARLGQPASYLGTLGQDTAGHLILHALRSEEVDTTRTRMVEGATSWSRVRHQDSDRFFEGSDVGVSIQWDLTEEDFAFMAGHQIVHSSIYSGLDALLPRIRQAAPLLSYDFSSEWTPASLTALAPLLDVAFLSGADRATEDCLHAAQTMTARGTQVVVVTRGEHGALAVCGGNVHHCPVEPAQVVDTLGAGDAFIAGFLNAWVEGGDLPSVLQVAAREAARNCMTPGAFGYGAPYAPQDARA